MIVTKLPRGVRHVADNLKDCFDHPSYQGVSAAIAYFMLRQESISEQVRSCAFAKSVSSQSRIVHSFNSSRAKRRLYAAGIRMLRSSNPDDLVYAIDDTSNPKYGNKLFATSSWGSSSGVYFGQKVLTLAIVDLKRKIAVPVSYAILDKASMGDKTSLDVGIELVEDLLAYGFPKGTIVADSWFDSADFAAELEKLGFEYVWQTKSNRLVKTNPSPNVRWMHYSQAFFQSKRYRTKTHWDQRKIRAGKKRGKCIAQIYCQIKKRRTPIKIIAVYNRRNGKLPYGYFASTQLSNSRARIWMISRARWAIETIFRTVKQNLSFGGLSCLGEKAAHLAVCLPFYLYTVLQLADPKTWGLEKRESVDRMLSKIRTQSELSGIESLLYGIDKSRINILKNRRSMARASRKPVNKPAGTEKSAA